MYTQNEPSGKGIRAETHNSSRNKLKSPWQGARDSFLRNGEELVRLFAHRLIVVDGDSLGGL